MRIACAMCFIGHGAFGIITKQIWCNYFGVFGIEQATAYQLMPVVGVADILFGLMFIFYPLRFAAVWLVFWGLFTASLRPLSHESFAEFLERAGNYGAPFILLILAGAKGIEPGNWFKKMTPLVEDDEETMRTVMRALQFFGFLLLAGHGWLNLIEKPGLLTQYTRLGFENPANIAHIVGTVEILFALSILIRPVRSVVLVILAWKIVSEMFYPSFVFFEWVERGGSYAILLSIWLMLKAQSAHVKSAIYQHASQK